ncbi:MAG: enoyl-ACP reductase [Candidatus Cloacimonadaceae bacterium]|jgi:enoyl-[acyl-carrier protein] reductase I|nr:enoyl-ACP reductase [Candidatus Cloacimonadota bacterium]MDY0127729.1 enoyl-ACP reductase [Candidatus Cloacimonadaceae bacterium]MCB5255428.1 enoyl-ACP reductase [Candidatus Cloacimonadota bacterium]MCK9178725.1 enoyl-ACP reductase [Candidatus Cloacimonadota bacterium]MCK9242557.1 enoyl-ACP reductase [Candidatus Cloacimonadota bacterium]
MNMTGKKALILGIANKHSIAYGIARTLKEQGVDMAISYAGASLAKRVHPIAEELGVDQLFECDLSKDNDIKNMISILAEQWDTIDYIVHSVAYAPTSDLKLPFQQISRHGFLSAMDISVYSLIAVVREAEVLLKPGSSVLTLTYYGGQKVVPGYGIMGAAKAALESSVRYLAHSMGEKGVRVNAISAGPIRTLSSSAIGGVAQMQRRIEKSAPLARNIEQEDIAKTALYLLSDLASGVTGDIVFVDSGISIMAY